MAAGLLEKIFNKIAGDFFVVDKKGCLIGRKAGPYQYLNKGAVDYYHLAPDADKIVGKATGREFHTLLDCVWGFSGLDVDEETSLVLAVITHVGGSRLPSSLMVQNKVQPFISPFMKMSSGMNISQIGNI